MTSASRLDPALAILAGLALACGDSVGPEDVPGSYVLRRVAMDPLPAILYDNEIYAVRVLSDTIRPCRRDRHDLRSPGGGAAPPGTA